MVRLQRLLIGGPLVVAALIFVAPSSASADSLKDALEDGAQSAQVDEVGAGVHVEASRSTRRHGSASGASTRRSQEGSPARAPVRSTAPLTLEDFVAMSTEVCTADGHCTLKTDLALQGYVMYGDMRRPDEEPEEVAPEPGVPGQVVTAVDVERFVPVTAEMVAEPDGWAVVGVPANFWTRVEPVVVDGELFGGLAQVRFTPRFYRWQYGDGAVQATPTGGASWEELGQEELTATATSHVYEEKGDLEASVTVVWSAEYRIGGGAWLGVAGAVASTTPPSRVLVVEERTVLTAR